MVLDAMLELEVRASGDVSAADEDAYEPMDQVQTKPESDSPGDSASTEPGQQQATQATGEDKLEVVTLQKELEAIETLIRIQQKKVDALHKMRSALLAMEPASELNHAKNERAVVDTIIERAMEAASMSELDRSSQRLFERYFVERATLSHAKKDEIVDVQMMKIHSKNNGADLLVVSNRRGMLVFYLAPSLELQRVDTKCFDLHAIALDLHSESPTLVALCGQSEVLTYSLELTNAADEFEDHNSNATKTPTYILSVQLASRTSFKEAVQAIAIVRTARKSVVCVGKADGVIDFYAANGTLLHQTTTYASNELITTQRNLLAFTNGSNLVVTALVKSRDAEFQVCPGSAAPVTSLAFDPIRNDILYAGTARGDILTYAFSSDSASRAAGGGASSCRLLSRATTAQHHQKQESPSVQLAVLDGYLFAATASKISIYATPRIQGGSNMLSLVCTSLDTDLRIGREDAASSQLLPALIAASDGSLVANVALVTAENQVRVFQSILPGPTEMASSSWPSSLYVGALFAVVLLSQLFFRRSQRRAAVNSWDGMPPFNSPSNAKGDADMMNAIGRATGRSFGAFAEKSSKHRDRYDPLSSDLRDRVDDARKKTMECSFDD